jgi:PPM family protein phosphatase
MLKKEFSLVVASQTESGWRWRPWNADGLIAHVPQDADVMARKGALFLVTDDGGHADGQFPATAVETAYYQRSEEHILDALVLTMQQGNTQVYERRMNDSMYEFNEGFACCTAIVLHGERIYGAHVGNCRAYLVRQGQMQQLTQDHTWVDAMVRAGRLQPQERRTHPKRHLITRDVLGSTDQGIAIDTFIDSIQQNDCIMLCTHGLWNLVEDEEICTIVEQHMPQQSIQRLIQLANERGGPDDMTVVVVKLTL